MSKIEKTVGERVRVSTSVDETGRVHLDTRATEPAAQAVQFDLSASEVVVLPISHAVQLLLAGDEAYRPFGHATQNRPSDPVPYPSASSASLVTKCPCCVLLRVCVGVRRMEKIGSESTGFHFRFDQYLGALAAEHRGRRVREEPLFAGKTLVG